MIQRGAVIKNQLKQQQQSQQNYQQSSGLNTYSFQNPTKNLIQQQQNRLITQQMNYYHLSRNYQQARNTHLQSNSVPDGNYRAQMNIIYKNIMEQQQKKIQTEKKGIQSEDHDNQSQISIDIPTNTKLSEIETTSFSFDKFRIRNHRINTKINYSSKTLVFEFIETSREDDSLNCNQKTIKKIELGFKDINEIEVRLENDKSLMIVSLNREFKKYIDPNQSQKGTNTNKAWIQIDSTRNIFIVDQQIKESNSRVLVAEFRKDKLTKFRQGKQSHLDRLRVSELPLNIKGQQLQQNDINSNTETQDQQDHLHFQMKTEIQNQIYDTNNGNNNSVSQEEEMFPLLKEAEVDEIISFQKNHRKWTDEYKVQIIQNTFKCKKYQNGATLMKKSTCPYFRCHKQFGSTYHLKQHLNSKHPYLSEMGLTVGPAGFQWTQKTLDFALSLAKIYPKFVRKVINEQKKSK